ncbi:BglG family transcription antiterminator [Pallidibacillus thermolactis]|uniref:BglG family transcription antiterminator n=1 Tax=Pallidibacillus thermolactis TaxID=251051 RepID=UPI0021DA7776|nr:BglG family transcription antiterminator [Pallidibacillus thermolactis]MCU9602372.1 transcription antiterminator [Pallidibacillus thermolactis subsp. kokeshiiformis]
MIITAREKSIIELILKKSGFHTVSSIANYLQVSKRTIQRDLRNIEKLLKQFDLSIENESGLSINGTYQNIYRLIQTITTIKPFDYSLEERRLLELIKLFDANEPIKLAPFSKDLGVSITTLNTDLDELSKWLLNYEVGIEKKKGVGVELTGLEESKRKALVSYIMINFKDELFDHLFWLTINKLQVEKIMYYFKTDYLNAIDKIVYSSMNNSKLKLADDDYIVFIIHLCLSLQRIQKGFTISKQMQLTDPLKMSDEHFLVNEICKKLYDLYSIKIPSEEIMYLTTILRGSKLVTPDEMYFEKVQFSRSIKELIQQVSQQLNVDLINDFTLFQGLLNHLETTIYRKQKGFPTFNPLTEEIKQNYPILFLAVRSSLFHLFPNIAFSEDEIASTVLHFGSALELKKEKIQIRALIICPTGIGTSKMLSSRLKNEFPEISTTDVVSLKELPNIERNHYQIILSTVLLPIQEKFDYVYVNPLLHEKDIEAVRDYLGTHIQEITKRKSYYEETTLQDETSSNNQNISLYTFMNEIDTCIHFIRTLFRNFSVVRMENEPTYDDVIKKMLIPEAEKGTITSVKDVFRQVKLREAKGGLGIPETNLALFHCRNPHIKEVIFKIVHVDVPYKLKGMDMAEMEANNILLLLAPEKMNSIQQEFISMVSTTIIENNESIMIFSSGNEKLIREKLEYACLHFLQSKFMKE